MSIHFKIYGRDYSKVCYDNVEKVDNYNEGIKLKGIPLFVDDSEKDTDENDISNGKTLNEMKSEEKVSSDEVIKALINKLLEIVNRDVKSLVENRNFGFGSGRKGKELTNITLYDDTFDKYGKWQFQGLVGFVSKKLDEKEVNEMKELVENLRYFEKQSDIIKLMGQGIQVTLQILSRFDDDKPHFLSTMLLASQGDYLNDKMVPQNNEEIFDFLLVYMFVYQFKEAYKNGIYKTYQRYNENNYNLRGRIDIARHLQLNAGINNGKIAYTYKENTIDNALIHLILHTYELIKRKFPALIEKIIEKDFNFYSQIGYLRVEAKSFEQFSCGKIISKNLKTILHPLYHSYESLRKICLAILRHEGISVYDGSGDNTNGMLFYVPDLWEDYLASEVLKDGEKWSVSAQKQMKIIGKEKNGKSFFSKDTYPDFVFYDKGSENNPFMILDAKFRRVWGEKGVNGDILGDYDKCIRDMNTLAANATGVVFPVGGDEGTKVENKSKMVYSISEHNKEDRFYTFPIHVPRTRDYETYDEWKNDFKKNIDGVIKEMEESINDELEKSKKKRSKEEFLEFILSNINKVVIEDKLTSEKLNEYKKLLMDLK